MIGEWVQLGLRVVFALFLWVGVALVLAEVERKRPRAQRYRDVARDHTEHGDEDPPRYGAAVTPPQCALCGGLLVRARDGMRCYRCCRSATTLPREAELRAEARAIEARSRAREQRIAPPAPRIARRRDGIRLGDDASAALWRDVMGTDEPPRG